MNKNAELHLAKAQDYVARGEEFYRKAATEIVAAMDADPSLSSRQVAELLGKGKTWVNDLVTWHTSGREADTPYSGHTERNEKSAARRALRDSTPEQVAEILEDPEIRRNVAKAQDLRHTEQKQRSENAYRESIGESTADALDSQQVLMNAEAELFKSRRALRDALAILRTIDPTEIRDSWLDEFVKTFDDIAAMLELGRSLVDGESVDEAIDRILEGSQ